MQAEAQIVAEVKEMYGVLHDQYAVGNLPSRMRITEFLGYIYDAAREVQSNRGRVELATLAHQTLQMLDDPLPGRAMPLEDYVSALFDRSKPYTVPLIQPFQ